MIYTTLQKCKDGNACIEGYRTLVKHVGTDYPKDKRISLMTVLESNGLDDALWVLDNAIGTPEATKIMWLFNADCAAHVLHFFEQKMPGDDRPRKAIKAKRDFANGKIDDAAWDAARDAAGDAAGDAAWAAAGDAAWAAAGDAARDAARDAAWAAAGDAARDAEIEWQTKRLKPYLTGAVKNPTPLPKKQKVTA